MASWPSFLMFDSTIDGAARAISLLIISIIIVKYSSIFEEQYTKKLINLYLYPWWRILIIFLVLLSTLWCPRVGIIMALLVFFYFSDMETLITPLSNL
jgi:hypothetical protein